MSVGLDLDQIPAGIGDHHLGLLVGLTLVGDGRRLHDDTLSEEAGGQRLPFAPREGGAKVPGPRHRAADRRRIVLERHLSAEQQGVREGFVLSADLGAEALGVETDGLLEIRTGNER